MILERCQHGRVDCPSDGCNPFDTKHSSFDLCRNARWLAQHLPCDCGPSWSDPPPSERSPATSDSGPGSPTCSERRCHVIRKANMGSSQTSCWVAWWFADYSHSMSPCLRSCSAHPGLQSKAAVPRSPAHPELSSLSGSLPSSPLSGAALGGTRNARTPSKGGRLATSPALLSQHMALRFHLGMGPALALLQSF